LFCKEKIVPFRPKKKYFHLFPCKEKEKLCFLAGESDGSLPGGGAVFIKANYFCGAMIIMEIECFFIFPNKFVVFSAKYWENFGEICFSS
jgi:hypothetical protein